MRTNKQLLAVIAAVSLIAACVATCLKYDTEYKFIFGVISWLLWIFAVLPIFCFLIFGKERDL